MAISATTPATSNLDFLAASTPIAAIEQSAIRSIQTMQAAQNANNAITIAKTLFDSSKNANDAVTTAVDKGTKAPGT